MDGGTEDDNIWLMRWKIFVSQLGSRLRTHKGAVGWRFVKYLLEEFWVARYRRWNAERPMVFTRGILQTTPGARKAYEIYCRVTQHLDLWEIRKHITFFSDTVAASQSWPASMKQENEDTKSRAFKSEVVNGNIRAAVQVIRLQGQSGVLLLGEIYSKTG